MRFKADPRSSATFNVVTRLETRGIHRANHSKFRHLVWSAYVHLPADSVQDLTRHKLILLPAQRNCLVGLGLGDAPGTRTPNLVIKSHLLCQLS